MKIVFDHAIDGGAWPGPLANVDAVSGEVWLGPAGLLGVLETRLGLGARRDRPLQRATRLVAQLKDREGFWRSAFEVDPIGTARRLLRDRDRLRLWGWAGQAVSPRLAELHAATEGTSPSVGDRLWAVARGIAERVVDVECIVSHTRLELLPPAWREVFGQLRRQGVAIEETRAQAPVAQGDLAAARSPGFEPAGDGGLCLLRRYGRLETADEVAASLAASGSLDGVVVVGSDEVLDGALARLGLPRGDADAGAPASARLVTLAIEAAFQPSEIADLHALLVADPGPVPRPIARQLVRTLSEYPGRGAEMWGAALAAGLETLDADRREAVEHRVRGLLLPACAQEQALPMTELRARLDLLAGWARARLEAHPSLIALIQRCEELLEDAGALGKPALSRHELRRLQDGLGEPSFGWHLAQAGLAHVRAPGALLAPARAVIWWNFTRASATRPERLWLTAAERAGLLETGVEPPVPTAAVELEAEAWRRPLILARDALLLVCPQTDSVGEPEYPHPLWDELTANLKDARTADRLVRDRIERLAPARRCAVPARPLVQRAPAVNVSRALSLRAQESPSSVERLIGCSLSWALAYAAELREGLSAPLPQPGPLISGKIAHRILAQVLPREPTDEDRAGALATELFDGQVLGLCEELGLPQWQVERASLRGTIEQAARGLARLARKHGVTSVRTEVESKVISAGQEIAGRIDVLWDEPRVVIDLKWGKARYAELLKTGTAVQLAAYAAMLGGGGAVETAYLSLATRDLLTEPRGRLQGDGHAPGQFDSHTVWNATKDALEARRAALAEGRLEAPGAADEPPHSELSAATLQLTPPCRYCSFSALCGRGDAT